MVGGVWDVVWCGLVGFFGCWEGGCCVFGLCDWVGVAGGDWRFGGLFMAWFVEFSWVTLPCFDCMCGYKELFLCRYGRLLR